MTLNFQFKTASLAGLLCVVAWVGGCAPAPTAKTVPMTPAIPAPKAAGSVPQAGSATSAAPTGVQTEPPITDEAKTTTGTPEATDAKPDEAKPDETKPEAEKTDEAKPEEAAEKSE